MLRYAFSVQLSGSFSGSNTTWFISRGIGASLQAREHLVDLLGRQVLVEDVIDHHHRRVVAGGEALLLALQVELAVRRRLAGLDAEPLLDVLDDLVRAAQHAGDVRAHRDVQAADGLRLEHRVEARDLVYLDRRHREVARDRVHELGRQVAAVLVLRGPERRQHRRALAVRRKLREPRVDLVARVLAERRCLACLTHRSISPKTMSRVPMTATTSASMWPRTISSIAARCGKPGARAFRR